MSATSRLLREQRKTNRLLRELLSELQSQRTLAPQFYPVPAQPFPMEPYRFDHPERFRIGDFPPFYGTTTCGHFQ